MKLSELKTLLAQNPEKTIRFELPTGSKMPPHVHVTEVSRIDKRFVDCGGVFRTESICRLQTWFSDDTEHRLSAGKLLKILEKAAFFLETEDIEVDVEAEAPFISQFPIAVAEPEGDTLMFNLDIRHTACLAEDKCIRPVPVKESKFFKPLATLQPAKCCS